MDQNKTKEFKLILGKRVFDPLFDPLLVPKWPIFYFPRAKTGHHAARKILKNVTLSYDCQIRTSEICSEVNVNGLRGDMVTNRVAKALVPFKGGLKTG